MLNTLLDQYVVKNTERIVSFADDSVNNDLIADLLQEIKELKDTVALLNDTMDTRLVKLEGEKNSKIAAGKPTQDLSTKTAAFPGK